MLPNNFDVVRDMAHESALVKPAPTQALLSDHFIAPIREKLIADIVEIRREIIDPRARSGFLKLGAECSHTYPVGYCLYIRNIIYEILRDNFKRKPSNIPGLFPYQMQLRKIWCMTGLPSFQNAIQVGNYIIDAATDTVDRYRYPVKVVKIEDAGLRNPESHEDICSTIESYWGTDCYPNIYFPYLSPFFPVIGVTKKGDIGFMCKDMRHVDAKNLVNSNLSSAKSFIFNSRFSHKRLPEKYLELLHKIPPVGDLTDEHTFQPVEKPKLENVENMFKHARKYSPEILAYVFLRNFRILRGSPLDIY